jgi:hypothetical protein
MKKIIFTGFIAVSVLSSCGPSKEDYKEAAKKMCECTQEKNAESPELQALNIDLTEANYALCALDMAEKKDVNPMSKDFADAIAKNCPDLKKAHANYVKMAKRLAKE